MKSKDLIISLIVILSVFALSLAGMLLFLLRNGSSVIFNFDFGNTNLELIDSKETEPSEINKIYFNLYSTDVIVKDSENEKILVEYYSNRENNPKIELSKESIIVDESKYDVSCVGFCNSRRRVVLYLPSTYEEQIEIETKSGDVTGLKDLSNNNLKIKTSSGDVTLNQTNKVNVTTSSGDINIDKTETVKATTSSGEIEINTILGKATLQTSSGDVEITKIVLKEDSSIITSSGDVDIENNEGNCFVEVQTSSGDQRIKKSDRKSDVVLNIKTSSGDISVN